MFIEKENSFGICIGASTITTVSLCADNSKIRVLNYEIIPHHGNPSEVINKIFLNGVPDKFTITGRRFKSIINATSISEPEAIENAYKYLNLRADLIVSAGGENFIIYRLDKNGKISKALTGNKCASGTGEFFFQQISRMDLGIEDAVYLGLQSEPYSISGRCSVFCKSDCTHALNKGVPKENVVAGLARMTAQKIIELIKKIPHSEVLIIGGVSRNASVLSFLKKELSNVTVIRESSYFEALGAAFYSINNRTKKINKSNLFCKNHITFNYHDGLLLHRAKVKFFPHSVDSAKENDVCIIGLDVGSTTTKAVIIRKLDTAILASEYLRTNGNPIQASIECYKSLAYQIKTPIEIVGLGVTGSGRQIAALHAKTEGVVNEIIAHANATIHFDKDADTIFEIGGQDAKYTYITAGVPSDYAMNEACSAGTGSFLEEAAMESLGINYLDISRFAFKAKAPPNFNDQCSAFINSDIKNALQEGISKEDILAGLVYSICLNYINRVKGNRPVGNKIFMQGGVCYNKAVPIAMAALTGKEIIVPPEPGLMGAFGVALEIKKRLELNLLDEKSFYLEDLISRSFFNEKSFLCNGRNQECDRKCIIQLFSIDGKKYPFGGTCDKYYTINFKKPSAPISYNFVKIRQDLVFKEYSKKNDSIEYSYTVGIPKSLLTNSLYPLYYNFFTALGLKVILGDSPKQNGIDKKESSFCFPVELAHGFFQDLIDKKVDYIFLPHITETKNDDDNFFSRSCVLLQSEVYYLKSSFKNDLSSIKIISPILNFSKGYLAAKSEFLKVGIELNFSRSDTSHAFDFAIEKQLQMEDHFNILGKNFIEDLESDNRKFAIVLFGRSYNAYADEANLGIPQKFSSKNISVIPHDFLKTKEFESFRHMYWGAGKQILKSARLVKNHDQLFAVYITNFSCGPDSFIISYFRDIMGEKPSLTLELDSHSADAGINTRIEAAIDIFKSYREIKSNIINKKNKLKSELFNAKDSNTIVDSSGEELSIFDKSIKMLIPSMGKYGSQALAAAFRHIGINADVLPIYTFDTLALGKGNTSCKECMPLILNVGALLEYSKRRPKDEKTLLFMASSAGPCRFGQYHVYMEELIRKKEIKNFGIYTLTDEDSYSGLGNKFVVRAWTAITIADVIQNIHHAILTIAESSSEALTLLNEEWKKILYELEFGSSEDIFSQLKLLSKVLKNIRRKTNLKDAPKVALIGEIYVRHDEFSRINLIEQLASKNIVVKVAPVGEFICYSNYIAKNSNDKSLTTKLRLMIRGNIQLRIEKKIKNILSESGFYEFELIDVENTIKIGSNFIRPTLKGEAILTVGSAVKDILDHAQGIISIGPFGCMPSRVSESILTNEMTLKTKTNTCGKFYNQFEDFIEYLPFLAIETDGNNFPQIIQSKIEIFILQVERLHKLLRTKKEVKTGVLVNDI